LQKRGSTGNSGKITDQRQWAQVRRLFAKARKLEEPERTAYLEKTCRNATILSEVKSLLAHDNGVSLFGHRTTIGDTVFGHYEIRERIGEGGMALVYRARDTRLQRWVAVKALHPWATGDPGARERLAHEARSASALNHPNIVTVHEIAEENGTQFIVMEYILGKTLNQCIPPAGLALDSVLHYARQIADALAVAHSTGIIHGDIKPLNIMVTERGHLKLLDFGLASIQAPAVAEPKAKALSQRFGTKVYMAPELLGDRGEVPNVRSEIFSVGLIFHEMLGGGHAFGTGTPDQLVEAILRESPKPLSEAVPAPVTDIVKRCLKKNPHRRFKSMQEIVLALDQFSGGNRQTHTQYPARPSPPRHSKLRSPRIAAPTQIDKVQALVKRVDNQNIARSRRALAELKGLLDQGMSPAVREATSSALKDLILSIGDFEGRVIPAAVREFRQEALELIKMSTDSDLRRCFAERDFEFLDLYGMNFARQSLAEFSFKGCFLVEADFEACDLCRASFEGANIRNVDFAGATLSNADFTDADWFNAAALTEGQLALVRPETLLDCPQDIAGMLRFLKHHYAVPFEAWSPRLQEQLKAAWQEYLRPNGLRDRVAEWRRRSR
jgi:serine/threonine protein kinase